MNGFDFDSLRDPYAPQPGPEQREGVEVRAQELRAIARRKSTLFSALAVIVVVVAAGAAFAATRSDKHQVVVTNTTTTKAPITSTSKPTSTTKPAIAPLTSTPTTTTTPAVAPPNAESASFVSTQHGWILEHDGTVAVTTDGGHTWRPVGSLGRSDVTIRFADATHGFAFQTQDTNQPATLATDDGGATWKTLSTPWSGRVYDLAISHGTAYAVAFDNGDFRIWSSPAGNLSWTEDPITVPVGGGPVPSIQLVFSNGAGWLIEVDRIVVGGARMSTSDTWSRWTPPCATANGPASLAAWSATDLIASCDEGVWGSPPAPGTGVYTSHDAGATFQRHDAPVYGLVTAADPNDALLVTGDTIRRSVDGGRTWSTAVASATSNSGGTQPLDLGFTSNSQGFVIFANGQMVMTYDAGATWSAVTLP
jgi:photosystem II stability/assembly factor-like uncharacterized protein